MYTGLRKKKSNQQKCIISAGAATPVLIAGIATSSVGAATNIGMTKGCFLFVTIWLLVESRKVKIDISLLFQEPV
jgi:hypothetical protein